MFDHTYVFKNGNNVDCQIEAARELGVRFHASRGSMSLGESKGGLPPDDCVEDEDFILKDSQRVIERYHDAKPGSMTQVVLAPCSPFSVTAELLKESAAMARHYKVKLHTHLCETMDEERYTLERFQLRPVDWMETLGWLGDDVWFAHAIHVDDDEIAQVRRDRLRRRPLPLLQHAAGLGHRADQEVHGGRREGRAGRRRLGQQRLLEHPAEARQAMLLARLRLGLLPPEGPRKYMFLSQSHPVRANEWMTAREALELATIGGARVLGRSDIGSLEVGKCADFFSLDLNTVGYAGALHDPVAAVLFCAPQQARHTVVHGRRSCATARSSPWTCAR